MSVRNYIQNARNNANQKYMSWTGDAAPQNGGFRNLVASQFNTAAPVGANQRLANGGGGNNAPQSQPYILTISNASATARSVRVVILIFPAFPSTM